MWYYQEGFHIFTKHFDDELRDAGASREDVDHVMHHLTSLVESAEHDPEFENWKYRVSRPDVRGEGLPLVAAVDEENARIVFVTAL